METVKIINLCSIILFLIFLIIVIYIISKNNIKTNSSFEIGFIIISSFVLLTLILLTVYINFITNDMEKTIYSFKKFPSKETKKNLSEFYFWFLSCFSFSVCIGLIIILVFLSEKKYYKSNVAEIFFILISIFIIIYISFLLIYMIFYLKNEHLKNTNYFNKHKNKIMLDNITSFKNPLFNKNDSNNQNSV